MKCLNGCADAEQNFTWPTSRGVMSANLCGTCAAVFWNKYKNINAGQSLIISEAKTKAELAEICAEWA